MARRQLAPVLAVLLVACASADASGTPASTDAAEPQSTTPASTQAATSNARADCIATPESGPAIAEGLTVQGGGTLRDAYAVALAPDLGFGYVVAAEIDGQGMEGNGEIGTWAVGELGGGPIFAANTLAQEFSDWGAAANEGSPADLARDAVAASDEASAAEACAHGD